MEQDSGHVRKNLAWFPHTEARVEITEIFGSAENYFLAAVGQSSQEMPE